MKGCKKSGFVLKEELSGAKHKMIATLLVTCTTRQVKSIVASLVEGDDVATKVVNIRSGADYDVYCGRAGHGHDGTFGNPVVVGQTCPECQETHRQGSGTLVCYERHLTKRLVADLKFADQVRKLRGKTLACFCVARPWNTLDNVKEGNVCHAQVLAYYAEILGRIANLDDALSKLPSRRRFNNR